MKNTLVLFTTLISINSILSQESLIQSNNEFAFKLYNATRSETENFFISPFSLHIALAVANEGTKNETRLEMDSLLSIKNINNRALAYYTLIHKTTELKDKRFIELGT